MKIFHQKPLSVILFSNMAYTPIVATLGYVISPDKKKVLLIHRNARTHDDHYGKYNGLGGKMHDDEDIVGCMKREIFEEANIECTRLVLRGTINWTGFGPSGEDWFGFIFRVDEFQGAPLSQNHEGSLEWANISEIDSLPMWKGDKYFLPLVFDDDPRTFHGYMPYDNNLPLDWSFCRI